MKTDLYKLMEENEIDALLITGGASHNPAMYYFTGGVHLTKADLIIPKNGDPLLFHGMMERDEAAKTGLNTKCYTDYNMNALRKEADALGVDSTALRYREMFKDAGVTGGLVSFYGKVPIGPILGIVGDLLELMPDLDILGEGSGNPLLLQAMATKDAEEVERIRRMGQITTTVVGNVVDFLSQQQAKDGVLVNSDDTPITVGQVKTKINQWLIARDVENPHGTIFAIGRDAGVPHSAGTNTDVLRLGKTIIFDIFPTELGGGYHYDFTRTFCLGHAPDAEQALYDNVLEAYKKVMAALKLNSPCYHYQDLTCSIFEAQGHKTIRQDAKIESGYIHSLGHGVGLNLHEAPWFTSLDRASESDALFPGSVVTIEPGLYYPEKEMGCRLEDTVYVRPDGKMEILSKFPLDLIIPVK